MLNNPIFKSFALANRGTGKGVTDANAGKSSGIAETNSVFGLFDSTGPLGTTAADKSGAAAPADIAGNAGETSPPFGAAASIRDREVQQTLFGLALKQSTSTPSLSVDDTADHVINAAESTDVAFSVSGLAAGVTGAVTFTDSSNHQVVANVGGNGTYSANLSGLSDGAIASSLSVGGPIGSQTTAAGNVVSLDTDSGLNPTLSVNAADPTNVKFTVSGLESDYSGTVTFTDATGKSDVVPIGSNGNYSANLSNLANGSLTYLMTVSDPAGNMINVDPSVTLGPSGYADGAVNAPAGTPQFANLLNGYAVRPPWQVAGVDYQLACPLVRLLKDPTIAANLPAGVAIDATHHVIYCDRETTSPSTDLILVFTADGGLALANSGGDWDCYRKLQFRGGTNVSPLPYSNVPGSRTRSISLLIQSWRQRQFGHALDDAIVYSQGTGT